MEDFKIYLTQYIYVQDFYRGCNVINNIIFRIKKWNQNGNKNNGDCGRVYSRYFLQIILIGLFTVVLFVSVSSASEQWSSTFGGKDYDNVESIEKTVDGNYVFAGNTKSFGNGDVDAWIVKIDSEGKEIWSKNFGGKLDDFAYCIKQTSGNGYVFVGSSSIRDKDEKDVWLVKLDYEGNQQWSKTFGVALVDESGISFIETSDNGYIIAYTEYNSITISGGLIKTDSNGKEVWRQKLFEQSDMDWDGIVIPSVYEISGDGYIICICNDARSTSSLIKTDETGKKQWNSTYHDVSARYVQKTSDGGYLLAGRIPTSTLSSAGIIKTNKNGEEQWRQMFGYTFQDYIKSAQQASDGGYILVGDTEIQQSDKDIWLIKTDSNGNKEWENNFGTDEDESAFSVQQTVDGGYIIAGQRYSESYRHDINAWIIKTDPMGNAPAEYNDETTPGFGFVIGLLSIIFIYLAKKRIL